VCVLDRFLDDATLQNIAAEMRHSETAFLVGRGPQEWALRWFTPTDEVDLCGHATLAAVHVLMEAGTAHTGDTLTFHTLSGKLRARCGEMIELDFPLLAGVPMPVSDELRCCLAVPVLAAEHNGTNYLVEVADMDDLRNCAPRLDAIAALKAQGLIVTTATGCGTYDFGSRYFGPKVGVPEDPVTGSAHCHLAPYWATLLGKTDFKALQASARSGVLAVRIEDDRVILGGGAVTVMHGTLELGESAVMEHAA
jgi:PhzF family phenazine biosynthesis protein